MSESKDTGPEAGVRGVVEDVKGKAKEAIGKVTGDTKTEASRKPVPLHPSVHRMP